MNNWGLRFWVMVEQAPPEEKQNRKVQLNIEVSEDFAKKCKELAERFRMEPTEAAREMLSAGRIIFDERSQGAKLIEVTFEGGKILFEGYRDKDNHKPSPAAG
jgi:hypothetical protein